MVAILACPHMVFSNQAGHARGADDGSATVTGEGVHVSSREQRSLGSYKEEANVRSTWGGTCVNGVMLSEHESNGAWP